MSDTASIPSPDTRARWWPRVAFMVAFAIMIAIAQNLLIALAVFQALWLAFAGAPNARLARFGAQLGVWLQAVARYQTCAEEEKPFPWADWPAAKG